MASKCKTCGEKFANARKHSKHCDTTGHHKPGWLLKMDNDVLAADAPAEEVGGVDWEHECDNCGATPVVSGIGLCGPCCFGEADTMGGNW